MIKLKEDTRIKSAHTRGGAEIKVVEGAHWEPLWLYSTCCYGGVDFIIQADSFESAMEIAHDESETLPPHEVFEAYGFNSQEAFEAALPLREVELQEGYYYQSNASGSGIVYAGDYERCSLLTPSTIKKMGLVLKVEVES